MSLDLAVELGRYEMSLPRYPDPDVELMFSCAPQETSLLLRSFSFRHRAQTVYLRTPLKFLAHFCSLIFARLFLLAHFCSLIFARSFLLSFLLAHFCSLIFACSFLLAHFCWILVIQPKRRESSLCITSHRCARSSPMGICLVGTYTLNVGASLRSTAWLSVGWHVHTERRSVVLLRQGARAPRV